MLAVRVDALAVVIEYPDIPRCNGKIQLLSEMPKTWEIYDGREHFEDPLPFSIFCMIFRIC